MTAALVLGGGLGHPLDASSSALRAVLGAGAEVTDRIEDGLARLDPDVFDLLVVNALAFEMHDARYDADRAEHAFHLGAAGREAIESWVRAGRPILAIHTAVICFGDWPRWRAIIGGGWEWGRSWHPPIGPLEVEVGLPGLAGFSIVDERYTDLSLTDDIEVVATVDAQAVAWRRREGRARIACSTLGHDNRSLDSAGHRNLLHSLVSWLLEDACPS